MAATNRRSVRRLTRRGQPTASLLPLLLAGATGPFAAFGLPVFQHFLGGVLPAYVLAALLFGAGALVAWMWRSDENRQLATTIPLPVTSPLPVQDFNVVGNVKRVCVGNVTGMSNCVWRGSNTLESCCAAGRFELVSGVLELGYSTGVKVLIEGPVTYVINSPNGGCLRVGKVTVRFGETSETQNGKPESARRGEPPLPAGKSHPQNVGIGAAAVYDQGAQRGFRQPGRRVYCVWRLLWGMLCTGHPGKG